jgi:hypothetical protein
MAWEERRNGRRYFYRSIRVDGTVRKQYIGAGLVAEAFIHRRQIASMRRDLALAAEARINQALTEAGRRSKELLSICRLAVAAELLAAGYWRPGRKSWRKKRGSGRENPIARNQIRA